MFSRVIKNTLLVLLIIVIIHFIIKNKVLETVAFTKKKAELKKPSPLFVDKVITREASNETPYLVEAETTVDQRLERLVKQDEAAVKKKIAQENDLKELYNFVYDQTSKNELNSYFPEPASCSDERPTVGGGKAHDAVLKHHASLKKTPVAEPNNHKFFKNAVAVQEYADENVMNGGKYNNCLAGFDPLDANGFMEL